MCTKIKKSFFLLSAICFGIGASTLGYGQDSHPNNFGAINVEAKKKTMKTIQKQVISFNSNWKYGNNSKINSGKAILYKNVNGKNKKYTVCINAGHGTKGGESKQTLCHPDGTPKVTGGSTKKGAIYATAIATGMTFTNGVPESQITLKEAKILKKKLLKAGYNVLMIRESNDVQLDNIARTLIANQYADCHIALHWDSTASDKGAFYISTPEGSYRNMEPVKSNWKKHHQLGDCLLNGLKQKNVKIFSSGKMAIDLTQTSYSTIPSIDIELGDRSSDCSYKNLENIADGIVLGVHSFFSIK